MILQANFGSCPTDKDRQGFQDTAECFLSALYRNFQLREHMIGWRGGQLVATCETSWRDSVGEQYHSEWGREQLTRLSVEFESVPTWQSWDTEDAEEDGDWQSSETLILSTSYLNKPQSPLLCGDSGCRISPYKLLLTDLFRDGLCSWQFAYQSVDAAWFHSSKLEIPAYRELADPLSDLSEEGRKCCRTIEDATGIPTFYYLYRYYGRSTGELDRLCPVCGNTWGQTIDAEDRDFRLPFRCWNCRLASDVGSTDDEPDLALIGEFDQRSVK
jgi:predicted  nucleic acid-binding Zn ribbon protein